MSMLFTPEGIGMGSDFGGEQQGQEFCIAANKAGPQTSASLGPAAGLAAK